MEPEVVITDPPEILTGQVIAGNSFVVTATDSIAGFQRFGSGATLPTDIGPTAGKLLVLSLRDVSRPGVQCSGGMFDSNCAVLEVLESTDEGFVGVAFPSGRRNFYLQSTFRLELQPEPA